MKKVILISLITLSLQSCISSRGIIKRSKKDPISFSKETLNGFYQNEKNLWNDLVSINKSSHNPKKFSVEEALIKLQLITDSQLSVKLYHDGHFLDEFILEGKIKKDHFSIKRNFSLIPFFPIFFQHDEYKILLGNDKNGDLILFEGRLKDGFALIIGSGYSWKGGHIIPKIRSL